MPKQNFMARKHKFLSRAAIKALISAAVLLLIVAILFIVNIFVPVKYLSSYLVLKNKGAKQGTLRVRFVDVGFGDCTVVELPDGKNMLIDGGDGRYANQLRIFKFLQKCNINTIDYLICTSVKGEHCSGLTDILKYKTVKNIYMPYCPNSYINSSYRAFYTQAQKCGAKQIISEYGVSVESDFGYSFSFLSPSVHTNSGGEYEELANNPEGKNVQNNASAVVWLEYAGTSLLFTGDITSSVEEKIVRGFEVGLYPQINPADCNIIKLANHGHKDSSSSQFLSLFSPEIAVVSAGKSEGGYPSSQALSNAANFVGDNLYLTKTYGTVTIEVTKSGYKVV